MDATSPGGIAMAFGNPRQTKRYTTLAHASSIVIPCRDHHHGKHSREAAESPGSGADGIERHQSLVWLVQAGEDGFLPAQLRLGDIHRSGNGVAADHQLAAAWHRRAADRSDPGARISYGEILRGGKGVKKDNVEAYIRFSRAAAHHNEKIREIALTSQNQLAASMTAAQIMEAERRARES